MAEVLYPELSYQLVGIAYETFNQLGYGYQEKIYQKALAIELEKQKIKFKEQVRCQLVFNDKELAYYYLDFLVNDVIILELKVGNKITKRDFLQVRNYLKLNKLRLGIIVLFSKNGVVSQRVLNDISKG